VIRKHIHGDVIKTLREEARLTQHELAQLAGCSAYQVRRAENDPRPYVSASLIRRFAAALTNALDRPVGVDDLASDPPPCPTCGSPLAA